MTGAAGVERAVVMAAAVLLGIVLQVEEAEAHDEAVANEVARSVAVAEPQLER